MARVGFSMGESDGFTLLPKGTYEQEIANFKEGNAKTGTKQYIIKCKVVGGPYDEKAITHFFAITDKAAWRFRELLDAACVDYEAIDSGRKTEEGKPIFDLSFDTDDLIGRRFLADATEETDNNGKPRNNWNGYRPTAEAQAEAVKNAGAATQQQAAQQTAAPSEIVGAGPDQPLRRDRRQPTAG